MEWYLTVLKNYATFSGRARRKEYWFFILINALVYLTLYLFDYLLGTLSDGVGLFSMLYNVGVIIPTFAVTVRRLHDTSRSAWWMLLYLVPIVGPVVILYFTAQNGDTEENQFGAPVKPIDEQPATA